MAEKKMSDNEKRQASKRQPTKRANAEHTQYKMALVALRDTIISLFVAGHTIQEIQQRAKCSRATVYNHLADARLELFRQKKAHFDERLALHLDDALDTLVVHQSLLQDEDFLRTADPERLKAIGTNFGIISDKCFALLVAAGRRSPVQSEQPQPEQISEAVPA